MDLFCTVNFLIINTIIVVIRGHVRSSSTPTKSVIIHENVSIGLVLEALNSIDMMAADIMNAYITAPFK